MIDRSNVLPNALEIMNNIRSAPAPTPEDPLTGDYRAFVSDKGVEIGNLLKQSQEKKASKVTAKEIVGDLLNIINPLKGKKVNPREEQIRRDVRKGLGGLSPEQQDEEVQRRMNQ